jgi:hypothetical protein
MSLITVVSIHLFELEIVHKFQIKTKLIIISILKLNNEFYMLIWLKYSFFPYNVNNEFFKII